MVTSVEEQTGGARPIVFPPSDSAGYVAKARFAMKKDSIKKDAVKKNAMKRNDITVVIGGEAGQGLVTVGMLLSNSLVKSGYHIVVNQDYQSRVRGGHNSFAVRMSPDPITAPGESIDLLVAMDRAGIEIHGKDLKAGAPIIVDEAFNIAGGNYLVVPYEKLGEKRYENVIAFGVVCVLLGIGPDVAAAAIEAAFGKKDAAVSEQNRRALAASFEWAQQQKILFPKLSPATNAGARLMMNGNDAVALGALAAGVRLCSFYPMTPSTSIAQSLAEWGVEACVVVEQAEDEIAAINMAVGASFTGAPAIVPTSGGGFALMVEGVAVAGMTETPVVIVVGQRPGPATGLPTRTEQGELMFVIHAGHGEFPKAVFAPGTIEECFSVTKQAFGIAGPLPGAGLYPHRSVHRRLLPGGGAVRSGRGRGGGRGCRPGRDRHPVPPLCFHGKRPVSPAAAGGNKASCCRRQRRALRGRPHHRGPRDQDQDGGKEAEKTRGDQKRSHRPGVYGRRRVPRPLARLVGIDKGRGHRGGGPA